MVAESGLGKLRTVSYRLWVEAEAFGWAVLGVSPRFSMNDLGLSLFTYVRGLD